MPTVKPVDIDREIETLARRINQNLCILFIGPGALQTTEGIPINDAFALSLAAELEKEEIGFDETQKNNMVYMVQAYMQGKNEKYQRNVIKIVDLRDKFKIFLRTAKVDYSIYERLSDIPFTLIINTNYDMYFTELFITKQEARGNKVHFSLYDFSNSNIPNDRVIEKNPVPGKKNLVVYNLLGLCDDSYMNSMVITETELVRFVGRIHQPNTALPVEISNYIDENKYCLFLGFDFDQWYLKVVIRALWNGSQFDRDREKFPDVLAQGLPIYPTAFFYQETFKFYFITDKLEEFVSKLLNKTVQPTGGLQVNDVPSKPDQPVNIVFISDINSEEDNSYRKTITDFLKPLLSNGYCTMWTEDMLAGESNLLKRKEKIKEADIIIALVSTDFVTADKHLMIAEDSKTYSPVIRKIAVLLRPYNYNSIRELTDLNFLWCPTRYDGKQKIIPLSQFSKNEQENIISSDITELIRTTIYDLIK